MTLRDTLADTLPQKRDTLLQLVQSPVSECGDFWSPVESRKLRVERKNTVAPFLIVDRPDTARPCSLTPVTRCPHLMRLGCAGRAYEMAMTDSRKQICYGDFLSRSSIAAASDLYFPPNLLRIVTFSRAEVRNSFRRFASSPVFAACCS